MLGEGGMRGATLELCLSKLLYTNGIDGIVHPLSLGAHLLYSKLHSADRNECNTEQHQ